MDHPVKKQTGFYVALNRLKEDGFVDGPRARRHGPYAISPLGIAGSLDSHAALVVVRLQDRAGSEPVRSLRRLAQVPCAHNVMALEYRASLCPVICTARRADATKISPVFKGEHTAITRRAHGDRSTNRAHEFRGRLHRPG